MAAFLAAETGTGTKPSTLGAASLRSATLTSWRGSTTPTDAEAVKATLRGIRRTLGAAKVKKAPAVAAKVRAMVAAGA